MRLYITSTDRNGDEIGTQRAWLDDVVAPREFDLDGDMADFDPRGRA